MTVSSEFLVLSLKLGTDSFIAVVASVALQSPATGLLSGRASCGELVPGGCLELGKLIGASSTASLTLRSEYVSATDKVVVCALFGVVLVDLVRHLAFHGWGARCDADD